MCRRCRSTNSIYRNQQGVSNLSVNSISLLQVVSEQGQRSTVKLIVFFDMCGIESPSLSVSLSY